MKKRTAVIILVLAAVFLLAETASVITYPNEYKVIKTMGKISRVTTEPGFSLRIPFVQSETTISKSRQLYDIAPTEIYTSDKKKMEVDAYIIWKVTDPVKFTQTLNSSKASAESKISAMVYGALKATVSSTSQEELIASRDAALDMVVEENTLSDVEIQDITSADLQETPDGMKVIDENKDAVYNRMITERKNIAAAYKAQGESEAQKIRNMTDRETEVMLSEANAKAASLEAEGEAEYMKILSDAYNDPDKAEYYLFVRQLDAAKKSLKNGNTTLFLDSDSPLASIFENSGE